jgi:hypothetical protein
MICAGYLKRISEAQVATEKLLISQDIARGSEMGRFALSSEGTKCMDCGTILPSDANEAMYSHERVCTKERASGEAPA